MEKFVEQMKANLETFGDELMKVLKGEDGRKKQIVATILVLLIGFNLIVRLIKILPAIVIGLLMIKYLTKDDDKSDVEAIDADEIDHADVIDVQ